MMVDGMFNDGWYPYCWMTADMSQSRCMIIEQQIQWPLRWGRPGHGPRLGVDNFLQGCSDHLPVGGAMSPQNHPRRDFGFEPALFLRYTTGLLRRFFPRMGSDEMQPANFACWICAQGCGFVAVKMVSVCLRLPVAGPGHLLICGPFFNNGEAKKGMVPFFFRASRILCRDNGTHALFISTRNYGTRLLMCKFNVLQWGNIIKKGHE